MKALVIIPTYNEQDNLEKLVGMVLQTDSRLDILIIDDNSPDGTGAIADRLVTSDSRLHVIHRERKLGLGTAYVAGFQYALARNYDLVLEMDADFSHDPGYLPDFLGKSNDNDLVIGSRYLTGVNVVNWPMHRLLLSYGANLYARLVTGIPVRDVTSGFKCFRRRVLESLDFGAISSEGYAFQIEVNCLCWLQGFSIAELPIIFVDRTAGKTKMSRNIIFEALWIVWKIRLAKLFGRYRNKT